MPDKLHKTYERLLKHHPYGSALYTPVEAKEIYPGCIGAFNNDGHWIRAKWDITTTGRTFTPIEQELELSSRPLKLDVLHSGKTGGVKVKVKARAFPL